MNDVLMIPLTPWQHAELLKFADRQPHNFGGRPNSNLIRRGLLVLNPNAGVGFYEITPDGEYALKERGTVIPPKKLVPIDVVCDELEQRGVKLEDTAVSVKLFLLGYSIGREWPTTEARLRELVGHHFLPEAQPS